MSIAQLVRDRWSLARLVLTALSFACVFALVYVVTVHTVEGRLLGDASLRGALLSNSRVTAVVDRVLNAISVASLLGVVAVVAVIALIRLARLPGLVAIVILAGSNISTLLLKNYVLARPDLGVKEVTPATLNSLPSGHATAAMSAVAALLFVLAPRWRLTAVTVGSCYATVTALATMSAGWHRAGDAITAFLLVGIWSMAAATVLIVFRDGPTTPADREAGAGSPFRRRLEATAVIALSLGAVSGIVLTLLSRVRETTVGSATAFVAGGLVIAGTSVAVLLAVLSAVERTDPEHSVGLPETPPP